MEFKLKKFLLMLPVLLTTVSRAQASILMSQQYVLDFTKPEAKTRAKWFTEPVSDAGGLNIMPQGLGWNGEKNAVHDIEIETTEAIPVSLSWRTVGHVGVGAEIDRYLEGYGGADFTGSLYVRYSPDAKHWSMWQVIEAQRTHGKGKRQQKYSGSLAVPDRVRQPYVKLLQEYSQMDAPWKSDEDAAVRWILQKAPRFFEESLPFIGYVQFLFETPLYGGQRLKGIKFNYGFGVSGLSSIPKDPKVAEKRTMALWNFKAR